jgi:hypothetical protein
MIWAILRLNGSDVSTATLRIFMKLTVLTSTSNKHEKGLEDSFPEE